MNTPRTNAVLTSGYRTDALLELCLKLETELQATEELLDFYRDKCEEQER